MSGPSKPTDSDRDYIRANALQAIHSKPGHHDPQETQYKKKADYGQVPKYLSQAKQKAKKEKEAAELHTSQRWQQVRIWVK